MDSSRAKTVVRGLASQPLFVPVILGLLVLGVLIHGGVTRVVPEEQPAVSELEPRNEPLVAKRSGLDKAPLDYFSEYWFQLGDDVSRLLLEIGPSRIPGVVVAPGIAVSTLEAADKVRNLEASREAWKAPLRTLDTGAETVSEPPAEIAEEPASRVLLVDSGAGLALFEAPGLEPPQLLVGAAPGPLYPGSLVAAVGLSPNGRLRIAPGHLGSSVTATPDEAAFIPLEATIHIPFLRGAAAIVDLNGELIGVAVEGKSGPRLVAWPTIEALLDRASRNEPCRAIEVRDLGEEGAQILGLSEGVWVERVRSEAFEEAPPVRAGDILLDWAGEPVPNVQTFRSLYDASEPGGRVPIVVWRDGSRRQAQMIVPDSDCRPVAVPPRWFAGLGFAARWTSETEEENAPAGWEVLAVRPSSRTDAVLEIGDRVVSVDGRALQGPASARELSQSDSSQRVVLGVWRRGRVLMLVPPVVEAAQP